MSPRPDPAAPGQKSVWDYPRPPVTEKVARRILVLAEGETLADTTAALCTLETSHPPTYYLPPADVAMARLSPSDRRSFCEWKGVAVYWHVTVGGFHVPDAAWSYPDPTRAFAALRDHLAFYAAPFECFVGGERVVPQPGGFYGGWITPELAGPFKGVPGSRFW